MDHARRRADHDTVSVLVLADTHAPRRWRGLPAALREPLARADLVLHAGDAGTAAVLDELRAATDAPLHAVLGNNDGDDVRAWGAQPTWEGVVGGVRLAMLHETGPRAGRGRRMRVRFPDADLVVYGHSHIPDDTIESGLRLFNPGSPTDRRRQPTGTYGVLTLGGGEVRRAAIVPLPPA